MRGKPSFRSELSRKVSAGCRDSRPKISMLFPSSPTNSRATKRWREQVQPGDECPAGFDQRGARGGIRAGGWLGTPLQHDAAHGHTTIEVAGLGLIAQSVTRAPDYLACRLGDAL